MGSFAGRNGRLCALSGAVLLTVALVSAEANATPSFPADLKKAVPLACAPTCLVCHTRPEGGSGTATQPFALSMMVPGGLVKNKPETVAPAVNKLREQMIDSNGDGTPDIEQLEAGYDPNLGVSGLVCGPAYGCGARLAPQRARGFDSGMLFVVALAAGGVFVRQRRRS